MNIELLRKSFIEIFGRDTAVEQMFFAPGRVCLIGEHIDYNGGLVLPAAISLGIYAVARPSKSNTLHIKSTLDNKEFVFDLSKEILFNPLNSWANYPLGVAKYFIKNGHAINGCEILFASTLPVGSGLSSSAAIEVLTCYILSHLNNIEISQQTLALAAKEVENNFVSVQCGIMDQFAVAFGKKNHAIKLNCTTLEYEYLPLHLKEYKLVIFNTNKKRELAESAFNTRVKECNGALEIIQQYENVACLADASLELVEKYIKDEILYKRTYHVVSENIRVAKAAEVLKQHNIESFGKLLFESHDSLKNNYEVSGKELDTFIDFAKQHSGCLGAKMTGAGFGGCAVAIVKANVIEDFTTGALAYYKNKTDRDGKIYIAEISDSVKKISE